MVAPALPDDPARAAHLDDRRSTWILTAYLLSASVATPIAGRVGDMFGKKRMLVVVLGALAAGALVSALRDVDRRDDPRPRDPGPRRRRSSRSRSRSSATSSRARRSPVGIALISAMFGIGGGVGIVLAGPIVQHLGTHWLFWLPFGVVLVAGVGAFVAIPESPVTRRAASTSAAPRCSPAGSSRCSWPSAKGDAWGLALGTRGRPVRRRRRRCSCVWVRGRDALRAAARRHADDAPARASGRRTSPRCSSASACSARSS